MVKELEHLIDEQRVILLGPIRQEVLSGIREETQFKRLRNHLQAFPHFELAAVDYEEAADIFNRCRAKGIQGSSTDFLLCAVARRHHFSIFTTDKDFQHFTKQVHVPLHEIRRG